MKDIKWKTEPTVILNENDPNFPHWFPNGEMNMCFNCLDKHCDDERGEDIALIYDCPYTELKATKTYDDMCQNVGSLAHILKKKFDIKEGD